MKVKASEYSVEALEAAFCEADKLLISSLNAISQNRKQSYGLASIYLAIFSFAYVKVIESEYVYLFLLFGTLLSIIILSKNLLPKNIVLRGLRPINLLEQTPIISDKIDADNQLKTLILTNIKAYEKGILINDNVVVDMSNNFQLSLLAITLSLLAFGILAPCCL